ncbi:hypothetical protein TWF481_010516 [Arthrobotrys musiformis]|uniref:AB hydrolase-1 domain-containing protein n=1 Tax=Arthrobotrys musiformis TaxID=47236 RepID=A0AAV9W2C0_9PEZI
MSEPHPPLGSEHCYISLPHKPTASICCTVAKGTSNVLVVFLNGLGLPQSHWWTTITLTHFSTVNLPQPFFLTYDRYGQGLTTDPDPQDGIPSPLPPGHRHDLNSVAQDLHMLIREVAAKCHLPLSEAPLIFVANSIGCALARYYAHMCPGEVAGLILLDSYMTDTNFIDLYPDPDAPDFDPKDLPAGINAEKLRAAREGMGKRFHPTVTNEEGFWRGNIQTLLPHSYEPKLVGWKQKVGGEGPYLSVVGHDWDIFAEESLRMEGMTKEVAMAYTNPAWGRYNDGLLKITSEERGRGSIATGAGHFIQQMRADLVADEIKKMLILVGAELAPVIVN